MKPLIRKCDQYAELKSKQAGIKKTNPKFLTHKRLLQSRVRSMPTISLTRFHQKASKLIRILQVITAVKTKKLTLKAYKLKYK